MSKRKPSSARQKELRARAKRGKRAPKQVPARARTAGKRVEVGQEAAKALGQAHSASKTRVNALTPQQTRDPRKISLARVVKRRDMGDLTGLARSIDSRGCLLQPVVITKDDELIAGQRRLAAWPLSKFRHQPIPVHVVDVDSIIAGEYDENAQRKDFTPSESVEIMEAMLPLAQEKARARQAHGKTAPGRKKADTSLSAAERGARGAGATTDENGSGATTEESGRAEDHLAAYLGRDRKTIARAKDVVDAARAEPDKFGKLLADMDKSGKVNGPWRRLQVLRQVDDIAAKKKNGQLDLPAGKYDRLVADVPWPHELDDPAPQDRGRATRGYPTMAIADIKALPIKKRLAKDCVVYFWTTNFHMESAYQILRAWGLDHFPTIGTWAKETFGKGQRLREQTEHCIIAIKGKPVWNLTDESTLWRGDVREDGRKPDEFYALIDRVSPAQRSLELFARRELPEGWEGYGDQVGKFKDQDIETFGNISEGLLKVLSAIEAGESIAFNENDHVVRGLFAGKRKRKLTKAGREKLAGLREEKAERDALAELPAELEALIADYRATLERRHAAVMACDAPAVEHETRRLDLLQSRANGGTHFGMGTDESPAEQLRRAAAAAIGEVPMWGQRGMFRLEIDGMPHIVSHDEGMDLDVHAEDRTKPFLSETGYQSLACGVGDPDEVALGHTVAEQARAYIREEIANPVDSKSGRNKPRGKKNPLPLPSSCYRLPRSWEEALEHMGPISVDDDDRAKRSRERLSARAVKAGHTVSMTLDHSVEPSMSVATCQCGWVSRVEWKPENAPAQDAAVEAHWRQVTKPSSRGEAEEKTAARGSRRGKRKSVIAGLDPAIDPASQEASSEGMDARVKPAHDEVPAEAAE
jgi:N6-adenosine-specific RNA methylase IME4